MNIKENIRIAIFSIRTNLMRSLLTMLGIIIGVASVIAVITVGNGGRDYIVGMIKDMGSNAINIRVNATDAQPADYITSGDIKAIKELENTKYVSPMVMTMGSLSVKNTKSMGMLMGCDTDMKYIMSSDCIYGRYFTQDEYNSGRSVCVIDKMSAIQLFGEANVVGQTLSFTYNDIVANIKIVGVIDMAGMFGGDSESMMQSMEALGGGQMMGAMVMVPTTLSTQIMGTSDRYDTVYLMASDENELENAGNAAMNRIRARHNNYDKDCYILTNMATYI
ncbi:MAG: ABC transporter permease, partial [Oscillospiraceae bacterium]